MNRKIVILLSFIFFTSMSCKDNSVNSDQLECNQKIIIDNSLLENSPNDKFEFINVELSKNCLNIIIEYGGGCGIVESNLIAPEMVMKSNPPQMNVRLSFYNEDASCYKRGKEEISFDLSSINKFGLGEIILHLQNWEKSILYTY